MPISFTPVAPWTVGQAVQGSNGVAYEATATNAVKPAALVIPPAPQELFCAGDVLPANAEPVVICLVDALGNITSSPTVSGGATLPTNIGGCVQVDEATGDTAFVLDKPIEEVVISETAPDTAGPTKVWFDKNSGCMYFNCDGNWVAPVPTA